MIEILSQTALATVQDLGRVGALGYGVGTSGAMDALSLAAGNMLLGNQRDDAGIEVQVFPFQIRFDAACAFVVTGANCGATLDDQTVWPWWVQLAEPGQVLRLGMPRTGAWRASRAYVCLAGGVDVPAVLGSRSTQLRGAFGGHEGRALRQGDRLRVGAANGASPPSGFGLVPAGLALPLLQDGMTAIRVLPAAQYDRYLPASQVDFWQQPWKITPQSDRYGYRLAGPVLRPIAPIELRSHGIVPGVIQVPPNGQPIVQMCDAQPSGGYPKIATVIQADLWRLGQAPIGSLVRFVACDWPTALAAGAEADSYLADADRLAGLHRARSGRG